MQDLNKLLKETNLTIGKEDTWTWERDKLGDYSPSSGYTALVQHQPTPYQQVFEKIWNPLIPHKLSQKSGQCASNGGASPLPLLVHVGILSSNMNP
ncbi:hypothetical protein SLEP1_g45950 [Rubroshorea leprosula]|uniref:Uncharacterized protein n=1 Tax=Rubroshorea leprosula TaxID=152421 RepID=A0AAV5LN86_9ROSI|nr:hypothetical protein SLEP1_g45950 [Rubroshorea leprosula]